MSGPTDPRESGCGCADDETLRAGGYATGLDVWEPATEAYVEYVGDPELANAQLWSLRQAIRREFAEELAAVIRKHTGRPRIRAVDNSRR